MEERVDVLVATYNGEKYLREQLDSIINQTYKNIRILISDDCSKDKTQEILQEYEKKDIVNFIVLFCVYFYSVRKSCYKIEFF